MGSGMIQQPGTQSINNSLHNVHYNNHQPYRQSNSNVNINNFRSSNTSQGSQNV